MELSHWTNRCEGVTLVSLVVANPHAEAARFRVANRLDGPVWPPRVTGRPEQGWDSDGYEDVLDPGAETVLGYATPAPPAEPSATIEWAEPAAESPARMDEAQTARSYADPRPPRDVLSPVKPAGQEPAIDGVGIEPAIDRGGIEPAIDRVEMEAASSMGETGAVDQRAGQSAESGGRQ